MTLAWGICVMAGPSGFQQASRFPAKVVNVSGITFNMKRNNDWQLLADSVNPHPYSKLGIGKNPIVFKVGLREV